MNPTFRTPTILRSCLRRRGPTYSLASTDLVLISYSCQTRLDGIADKLASGGILFRLAPNSLRGEMDRLKQDVLEVDENTRVCHFPHPSTINLPPSREHP